MEDLYNELEEVKNYIIDKEKEIEEKEEEIDRFDVSDYATESEYDAWLDEIYGEVEIAGSSRDTSYVLKNIDPIMYNMGFSDYCYQLDKDSFQEYRDLQTDLEDLEGDLSTLEERQENIQEQIDELENDQ